MSSKVRYIVYPGYVISKTDGDRHLITARELMHLYGVDPSECIVSTKDRRIHRKNLVPLRPRRNGNYDLGLAVFEARS